MAREVSARMPDFVPVLAPVARTELAAPTAAVATSRVSVSSAWLGSCVVAGRTVVSKAHCCPPAAHMSAPLRTPKAEGLRERERRSSSGLTSR